jgi:hypothetical protein
MEVTIPEKKEHQRAGPGDRPPDDPGKSGIATPRAYG